MTLAIMNEKCNMLTRTEKGRYCSSLISPESLYLDGTTQEVSAFSNTPQPKSNPQRSLTGFGAIIRTFFVIPFKSKLSLAGTWSRDMSERLKGLRFRKEGEDEYRCV